MHWILVYKLMEFFDAKILALCSSEEQAMSNWIEENVSLSYFTLFLREENSHLVLNSPERVLVYCSVDEVAFTKNTTLRSNLIILLDEHDYEYANMDFKLAFDSQLVTVNQESGQIAEHYELLEEHFSTVLGYFTLNRSLIIEQPKFIWTRRDNLNGLTLKNSALLWLAVNDVRNYSDPKGYFPELLQTLQEALNFSVEWIKPARYIWGDLNPKTGKWRGIVGNVNSSKAQIGCSGLTATLERSEGVDFTFGELEEINTLITAKEAAKKTLDASAFIHVFRENLWIYYLLLLMLITVVVTMHMNNSDSHVSNVANSSWMVLNMCLQLDAITHLNSFSWRITFASAVICNYIAFCMYTCYLTAQLSASSNGQQLHSFQDLLDEEYVLYLNFGSLQHSLLANADPNSAKYMAYKKNSIYLSNMHICDSTICRIELLKQNAKSVIFDSSLTFAHYDGIKVWTKLNGAHYFQLAIALAKDSDLTSLFNYNLIKLYQSGTIERLRYKWMQDSIPGDMTKRIFAEEASPMGYLNVLFPTSIIVAGAILCLALVTLEKIYSILH